MHAASGDATELPVSGAHDTSLKHWSASISRHEAEVMHSAWHSSVPVHASDMDAWESSGTFSSGDAQSEIRSFARVHGSLVQELVLPTNSGKPTADSANANFQPICLRRCLFPSRSAAVV
jgi:hypothetical protein